jgi:hypothetical protein
MIKITILVEKHNESEVSNQDDNPVDVDERDPIQEKMDELTAALDELKREFYTK